MAEAAERQILIEEEAALVRRCLSGQDEAFEELVGRFQQMVYNLAYRFLGGREEAEDLSQEVFLKVFHALKTFRQASSLKTWIYRITTNMALNRLKKMRRRQQHRQVSLDSKISDDLPPLSESISNGSPGPDAGMRSADIHQRLQQALDELSAEQKAVVVLRDIEGLRYDEIAEALSINIGTVKSRLARGRSNVQDKLRDLL